MTDKMQKFVEIGQQTPPKRDVRKRKSDFINVFNILNYCFK